MKIPEPIEMTGDTMIHLSSRAIRRMASLPPILALAVALGAMISLVATPYMGVATAAYVLMVMGFILRKQRRIHVPLMLAAITADLILVLVLEINRDAVATALSMTLGLLQQLHIGASALATVLYIPVLILGIMNLKGKGGTRVRRSHLSLGIMAFCFRSLGFLFMFSLLLSKHA